MKTLHAILMCSLVAAAFPFHPASAAIAPSDLVRSYDVDTIYYVSPEDGKRYSFPSVGIFNTWYTSFERVKFVSAAELAAIPFGGVVYVRPGSTMVKITTDPKTYAIEPGGKLRHVANEQVAAEVYGRDWNTHIIDLDQSFFANYDEGEVINDADDYVPAYELHLNGEVFQTVHRWGEGGSPEPHAVANALPASIGRSSGFLAETSMSAPSAYARMLIAANGEVFARCEANTCRGVAGPFDETGTKVIESYACNAFGTCKRESLGSVNVLSSEPPFDLTYTFTKNSGADTATLRVAVTGGTPSLIRIDRQDAGTTACLNTPSCDATTPPLLNGPYVYTAVVCDQEYRCSFSAPLTIPGS